MSTNAEQFKEFLNEVKYAAKLVSSKKYTLGQYYDHMADFFEYANMPKDAEGHRVLAKKWKIEKGESNDN